MGSLKAEYVKKLPPPLRAKYLGKKRSTSEVQEIMQMIVALHLWQIGHRQIEFEYHLGTDRNGKGVYVDVCDLDSKTIIECVREDDLKNLRNRYNTLKGVRPDYKVVIAVRDVNGWEANKYLCACDDLWILRMNGDVIPHGDWPNWRISYLLEPLNQRKLELLEEFYKFALNEYERHCNLREYEIRVAPCVISQILDYIGLPEELFTKPESFRCSTDKYIEHYKKLMESARRELLLSFIELINRLLEIAQPFRLSLLQDGSIYVEYSEDIHLWLGYESTASNLTKIDETGQRNLEIELEVLQQHLPKRNIREITKRLREMADEVYQGKIKILNESFREIILEFSSEARMRKIEAQ